MEQREKKEGGYVGTYATWTWKVPPVAVDASISIVKLNISEAAKAPVTVSVELVRSNVST